MERYLLRRRVLDLQRLGIAALRCPAMWALGRADASVNATMVSSDQSLQVTVKVLRMLQ